MGNGEWVMGNGEWGMGNGEWGMGNGEWGMGHRPSGHRAWSMCGCEIRLASFYCQCQFPMPNDGRCSTWGDPKTAQPNLCPITNYQLPITYYLVFGGGGGTKGILVGCGVLFKSGVGGAGGVGVGVAGTAGGEFVVVESRPKNKSDRAVLK